MSNEKDLLPLDSIAEDLQHTAKAAATHIIILRQDRKSLRTTVDQLQAENKGLKQEVNLWKSRIGEAADYIAEFEQLQAELDKYKNYVAKKDQTIKTNLIELNNANTKNKQFQTENRELKSEMEGRLDGADEIIYQLKAELDKHKQPCKWQYDKWYEVWRTECNNAQEFMEGDVKDNCYKFCPYCGHKILEKK